MFDNLVILAFYVISLLSFLCTGAAIGDLVMEWQDEAANRCKYGFVLAGSCLSPNEKKCKFTTTMRNILAKLGFN